MYVGSVESLSTPNEPPEHLKYKILGNFQLLILWNVIISTPINFLNPTDPW